LTKQKNFHKLYKYSEKDLERKE